MPKLTIDGQVIEVAPGTADIEKVYDIPAHNDTGPVIVPGCAGAGARVIAIHVCALNPQEFDAETQTFPPEEPAVIVIVVVPCPEVIVEPAGTVQVYDVAPPTAAIVYV